MWDEEDGFYYDLLRLPDGSATRLKVRSLVGLLPLCATTVIEKWQRERVPRAMALHPGTPAPDARAVGRPSTRPARVISAWPSAGSWPWSTRSGSAGSSTKMLDENEFLSPYGIRSLSKFHEQNPYVFHVNGQEYRVDYLPAESNTGMFGGNSNWRGPVWMPVNALIIRALLNFYLYYGDNFKIECPTGSGKMMNLFEVSKEIADRLTRIFTRDEQGRRPGLRRHREVPDRSPLARPHPLLRVLPRRQRRRARRQPSDRLDRARGQAHRSSTASWTPSAAAGRRARQAAFARHALRSRTRRSAEDDEALAATSRHLRDQHLGVAR